MIEIGAKHAFVVHTQKCATCKKSVDMWQRLVTTSRYHAGCDLTACDSLLTTSLLQVVNRRVAS